MVTAKRRFDARRCLPTLGNCELAAQKTVGWTGEAINLLVPCFDLNRTVLPSGLSSTGDWIFGPIS